MGFSRQEYWSVLSFPSPGDLPNPGIKPGFPALQADFLPSEPPEKPRVKSTMLLNILQRTKQPPTAQSDPAENVSSAKGEKP